ncbi:ubiquitin-conjugating enzyme E2 W isoform X5 [Schistocerca piceifrons]|uniref:ubiquitin-conjugating enzyme E2 W isoform X5 n=1 Tax=Schistocerca piceifrons TaxID=274613 RepID=UPI001F5F7DC1|nr:ubiquitin-conjugating enzyme E2 W isoform X5 [Schistocerca piceifrons]
MISQLIGAWLRSVFLKMFGEMPEVLIASRCCSVSHCRRLQKELMSLMKEPPPGVTVDAEGAGQNLNQWIIQMDGAQGTLYEGEQFQLQFKFSSKYPFDSPEKRPPDNSFYVKTCNKNPKKTKWWYHGERSWTLGRKEVLVINTGPIVQG